MITEALINPFFNKNLIDEEFQSFIQDCINFDFLSIFDFQNRLYNINERKFLYFLFNLSTQLCDNQLKILKEKKLQKLIDVILEKSIFELKINKIEIFIILIHFFQFLFNKQNFIGPQNIDQRFFLPTIQQILTKNELDQLFDQNFNKTFQIQLKDILQFKIQRLFQKDFISNKFENFQKLTCVNGEPALENVYYFNLLILSKKILKILIKKGYNNLYPILNLQYARINRFHGKVMQKPSYKLWKNIQQSYRNYINFIKSNLNYQQDCDYIELLGLIKIEFALCSMYYYKTKLSKKLIMEALSVFGLEVQFQGLHSVKIKKQLFVQKKFLVQVMPQRRNSFQDMGQQKINKQKKPQSLTTNKPTVKKLSDIFDFILREKPKFDQFQGQKFNLKESVVIMGLISHVIECNQLDVLNKDNILLVLQQIIKNQNNWSLILLALYYRSILEFSQEKKRERAMMQLEEIVKDIQFKQSNFQERFSFFEYLDFPCFNTIICQISQFYLLTDCHNASASFLQDYGLRKEALQKMYQIKNQKNIVQILKNINKYDYDSDIYCFLGKIQCDQQQYLKGIQISSGNTIPCLLAQGRFLLKQNDYYDSLSYFQQAQILNPINLEAINCIAYIYWQQEDNLKAIQFYTQSITINDQQAEIYLNLSLIYRQIKMYKQSIQFIEKSLQISNTDWKIYSNYAIICWEAQENNKMIKAMRKLVYFERQDQISDFLLRRLIEITSIQYMKKGNIKYLNDLQKQINKLIKKMRKGF